MSFVILTGMDMSLQLNLRKIHFPVGFVCTLIDTCAGELAIATLCNFGLLKRHFICS